MSIQNLRRKLISRKNTLADCSGHLVLLHSLFGQPNKSQRKSPGKAKKLTVYLGACVYVCVVFYVYVCVCINMCSQMHIFSLMVFTVFMINQ